MEKLTSLEKALTATAIILTVGLVSCGLTKEAKVVEQPIKRKIYYTIVMDDKTAMTTTDKDAAYDMFYAMSKWGMGGREIKLYHSDKDVAQEYTLKLFRDK